MVGWELYMEIRILRAQGHSLRAIARETGLAVNTVRKYLERPDPPRYGPRRQRPGKRDPFRAYLMERIQAALPDRLSATVLHREVKALGYTGQVRWLRQMIAELRPKSPPEPLIRFETPPGKQGVVATFDGKSRFPVDNSHSFTAFCKPCADGTRRST